MANGKNKLTAGQIIYTIFFILLFLAVIFFLAGDWFWIEGWIFIIWFIAMSLTIGIYLYRNDPALLAERSKMPGGTTNKNGISIYYPYYI